MLSHPIPGGFPVSEGVNLSTGNTVPFPVELLLEHHPGATRRQAVARWSAPTKKQVASYQPNPRTEHAAECVCLAALRARDQLTICGRSEQLSGADWLVGRDPSQPLFRVEVSGIDTATANNSGEVRLRSKVDQIQRGRRAGTRPMPGIAAVFVVNTRVVLTEDVPLE